MRQSSNRHCVLVGDVFEVARSIAHSIHDLSKFLNFFLHPSSKFAECGTAVEFKFLK